VKIRKIWAENVRNIKKQVLVAPSVDGVTILHAPNEFGKTTLAEVVSTLLEREYSSNHGSLKLLQRADSTSGPTMGMEFQLGDDVYWLEKTWLKGKNCTLRKISPEKINFEVGEESESELSELIGDNFDEVLWRIVQVGQGNSSDTFDSLTSIEESSFLQQAFDRATEGESSESDESFLQALTKEYSEWFTDKGKPRREKDSRGKLLSDKSSELDDLHDEVSDLQKRLKDADRFEKEAQADTESIDTLKEIQAIQQKNKDLERASKLVNSLDTRKASLKSLSKEHPYVTTWDSSKFEEYRSSSGGYQAFKSLKTFKITALKIFDLKIDSEESSLSAGDSKVIPITSDLTVGIGDLARLDFPTESDSADLREQHDRFIELGQELGISSVSEGNTKDAKAREWKRVQEEISSIELDPSFEEAQFLFEKLSAEKQANLAAWQAAVTHKPVSQDDLLLMTKESGKKEGRYTEIRSEGVLSRKDRSEARVRTLNSEIEELELQRDGINLLWQTVNYHKDQKAAAYSEKFEEQLNELVSLLYPGETKISIDSDFTISGRNQDGTVLALEQLSIGAKEQISFLSRLAIAQIASTEGSVPLILDDDLVSTDDRRLKGIGDILERIQGIQVLIFTCHPERFKAIPHAKSIDLEKIS
jgi:hypothetical protein